MEITFTASERGTYDRGDGYDDLLSAVAARIGTATGPIFTTSATGLADAFVAAIPEDSRQHYECRTCRAFIDRYGGLVTISETGIIEPLVFPGHGGVPFFAVAAYAVYQSVRRSKVTGVFLSSEEVWGRPETGPWKHLAGAPPRALIFPKPKRRSGTTADQAAAQKLEDFKMLQRGLAEFPRPAAYEALKILRSETLYRSEKVLGVGEWFAQLHQNIDGISGRTREAAIWRAVATAPPGFVHIRSTMISTLLEDIVAGRPFDEIAARFRRKMDPLQYQRPTAPPSDGQLAQAEKIVAEMGAAGSLARRFARLEDLETVWRPTPETPPPAPDGVFGHLKKSKAEVRAVDIPSVKMTWEKFSRTILPGARRLELYVANKPDGFGALVTAVNPTAPPLLQWDNPVSWYVYARGSMPSTWNLRPSGWAHVTAITLQPSMWGGNAEKFKHHGEALMLVLEGARDTKHERSGGFFKELLRAEFHPISRTLEAYANAAKIEGQDEATACGLILKKGEEFWSVLLRVNGTDTYNLDRWD